MKLKRIFCLLAALLLLCAFACAQEDEEEEVYLFPQGNEETVTDGEDLSGEEAAEADAPADPTQPVYEPDGSIELTMTFAGDFTIGSNVQASGTSIFDKELERQSGNKHFMFRNVRDILLKDDLTMINFEGTLTTAGRNPEKKNNDFLFRASPDFAEVLLPNGVETVALENNHVLDMGAEGLADTKANLTEAGVTYACEDEPAEFWVKGVKIGSLAYQTFGGRHDEIIARLPADVQALRDDGCEIIIASFHWGAEKDYAPNKNQIKLGRAAIDAGVDLVVGHHSHRINPIEYYNGHYICYSLGNFIFAGNNKPSDMSSYLFQIRMSKTVNGDIVTDGIRLVPGRISSRTDYNDFCFTPFTKTENIQAEQKLMANYGKDLKYALDEYPLKWPDE